MNDSAAMTVEDNDDADDEAFVSYDIAAYPADYTLSVIAEMWAANDIVVPPFQRKFVWTIKQSSLLIESLLMGLPVPQAFFYVDQENRNLVIDGLQRIMSIVYFFSGLFGEETYQGKKTVFRLTGLNEQSPYAKKTFEDLSESEQRKLRSRVLRVINVRQLGPKNDNTSAYHIFERLNTGGTPLTAQEIRHCVFHGRLVDELSTLNTDPNWRRILGNSTLDRHQKDVELILRVLAFSLRPDSYEKPMKAFLNSTMSHFRNFSAAEVSAFAKKFPQLCEVIVGSLGAKPFNIRGKINASALDSVMAQVMASIPDTPANLSERYDALKKDAEFLDTLSVSTSDASVVKKRLAAVRKHLAG